MNASQLITACRAGLESLRTRGLVDPQCLMIRLEGSQLRWSYFKFSALPGHPAPGNAHRRMPPTNMNPEKAEEWRAKQSSLYSHPADLACFRQSTGFIANMLAEKMPQADALLFAKELSAALFGEEIVEVEIARRMAPTAMGVAAYELPECKPIRHGDKNADAHELSEIVFLRHGRTCWEEFPREGTVDTQPDFEGHLGYVVDENERKRIEGEII